MLSKLLTLILIGCFMLGGYVAYTAVTLPNVRHALEMGIEPSQTSQIFARDKTLIMSYGKFQHKPVPLAHISPTLIEALLATEDRRFYQHKGVDPLGILRAMLRNVTAKGVHEGGSTLTQQLARNIFLSNERSIQRKIKEALLAIKIEQQLTKDQILELYLNNVYFGEGTYGVGAASNIYFGKTPKALTKDECALLAGMPQAPSLYSPFVNPNLALKRRNEVLDNLVETHKLTTQEAEALKARRLRLNPNGRALSASDRAPFFSRYVIREILEELDVDEQTFWQQGLKVYTTIDPRAQQIAQAQVRAMSRAFGRTGRKQQAALLSLDAHGGIIAYVGGKDFGQSQFDRVSQAQRQAGSLFKVFVYTAAMERGYSPLTVYKDAPVEYGTWKPENYDKRHHGYMTLAQALAKSNNIIAVKLLHDVSPEAVIQVAQKMGIASPLRPNLSLALGSADVTLNEMTGAFSTFSRKGVYVPPYGITKIVDRDGRILYQHQAEKRSVLQRPARDTMVALMRGVVRYGTARGANFGDDIAGKTGTSDNYRDAWFIGYTPDITTGVWVGNDDNSPMPGVTGGSLPARIWRGYMARLLSGMPKREFDLAQAMPVEEKDFFVYNLENLSASEGTVPQGEQVSGDVPSETSDNPEGGATPPDNTSPETTPTVPPEDGAEPAIGIIDPTGPDEAPRLVDPGSTPYPPPGASRNPADDRNAPNHSASPQGRFETAPGYAPRSPRFAPDPASGRSPSPTGGSRPILDPAGSPNNSPRTRPRLPQEPVTQPGY